MITVIGSINLDLVANVARLPKPGETVPGSTFKTAPGGKGANQALAAARAGVQTRMIGAVGRDAFADEALALLRAGGVDTSHLHQSAAATGTALIMVDDKGENIIAVVPGANASVLPGGIAKRPLEPGIVLLQHEIPLETVDAALDAARAAGVTSILNTAPFRIEAAAMLEKADYVVANETEFDLYAKTLHLKGAKRLDSMQDFAGRTGRTVIVTLGEDGVIAVTPKQTIEVPAMKIDPVDTVGAGDTFCGYLGAGLDAGLPLRDALHRAAVAASLACLKPGAQQSIPMAEEVAATLKPA
ncbi:MAG: ribokinase [Rhizobiaceae bacterium]|nr:ribokinase [Rhizobiaceae bacterium]